MPAGAACSLVDVQLSYNTRVMQPILTYSTDDIAQLLVQAKQPAFRQKQLLEWLFVHQAKTYDQMTTLPASLRSLLAEEAPLIPLSMADCQISADGTRKYLFTLWDNQLVETVAIPGGHADNPRLTVCFSTQVGCPMGCVFCATGHEGFTRNLGMGEIVSQILAAQQDMGYRVSNVVAMGQGEPFANYRMTLDALRVLNNPKGIAIGARKITVSTSGIIEGIRQFAQEPEQFTLAVSLHAARQEVRNQLMPGLSGQPLSSLRAALEDYIQKTNRRVTFEYLMIKGVNDSAADQRALLDFCSGLLCHVNFLPMNAVATSPFSPSAPATIAQWVEACDQASIEATVRHSRGSDIQGACGQLKNSRA